MADRLEAAIEVEPACDFVGDALVLGEAVLARQPNGFFVQTLGVELPTFYASYLGTDQHRAVPEILRAVLRPYRELLVVDADCLQCWSRALVDAAS